MPQTILHRFSLCVAIKNHLLLGLKLAVDISQPINQQGLRVQQSEQKRALKAGLKKSARLFVAFCLTLVHDKYWLLFTMQCMPLHILVNKVSVPRQNLIKSDILFPLI